MDIQEQVQKNPSANAIAIIVGAVIIAGAIYFTRTAPGAVPTATPTPGGTQPAAVQPTQAPVNVKDVKIDDEPFIGSKTAPVTLVYWTDYQCPFCKAFETTTFQTLLKNYVDSNKLRIVFKDFSFLGSDSTDAAIAGRAVWEQYPDKYFAWREAMFSKQDDEGDQGFGDKASIIELTKTITGIDANKISQLMDSKKTQYQKMIDDNKAEGNQFGVTGTPGFITGTTRISGNQPLATFTAAIDAQLK